MPPPLRIILVDDHDLIRESWEQLLNNEPGFHVIAALKDGAAAIGQVMDLLPDVILMDMNMSPVDGFQATKMILSRLPSAKIIGISINNNPAYAERLMALGGKGFVTKTSPFAELKTAILKVHGGETYICEEIRKQSSREDE
jgi:DNA-binding NarL/FixJ family response regulator